jgi:hypothetical protein
MGQNGCSHATKLHRWSAWGEIVWNQAASFEQIGADQQDTECAECTKNDGKMRVFAGFADCETVKK